MGVQAFFILYRFVLPCMFGPLSARGVIGAFVVSDFTMSWWLALIFQANHVVGEVEWPLPDHNNVMEMDWAQMQVETAQDYGHDSWLQTVCTGGLNYQVVHHLFPNVS
jgi:fatty acid desaturase